MPLQIGLVQVFFTKLRLFNQSIKWRTVRFWVSRPDSPTGWIGWYSSFLRELWTNYKIELYTTR